MSKTKIAPMMINGKTVMVEVEEVEIIAREDGEERSRPSSDLRRSATPTGVADTLSDKCANAADTLEAVVGSIEKGLHRIRPDEWAVEVNIGFAGEKQIPFIAKGSLNSGIKVSAKWIGKPRLTSEVES